MQRRQLTLAALALSAIPTSWAQIAEGGSIVLGQSAALTGVNGKLGQEYGNGAKLHFDSLNAKGGVGGRRIELRQLDDGYNPQQAEANTKKFIEGKVFALFGYYGGACSLAALPIASQAKLPLFAPLSGAQALREPYSRYAVHVRASYDEEISALVRHALTTGVSKLGVLYQEDAMGLGGLATAKKAMAAAKLEPSALGKVAANTVDVAAAVTDLVGKQPHGILQLCSFQASAAFIRAARSAGYKGNFYNLSAVGTQSLTDELGPLARGIVVSEVVPYPYRALTGLSRDYLAALNGQKPSYLGMEGFVAANVFAEGLRRAGRTLTAESFLTAIEGIRNLNLGGFVLDYGPRINEGSKFVDLVMLDSKGVVMR
jgi:branched-chain amino acid transport system substrate-binding protein